MRVDTYTVAGDLGKSVRDAMQSIDPQKVFEPFGKAISWEEAGIYISALLINEDNRVLAFSDAHPEKGAKEAFWNVPFNGKKNGGKHQKFFIETLLKSDKNLFTNVLKGMISYYNEKYAKSFGELDI